MTAASHTSRAFAATGRSTVGWRHVLAVLAVCLPVPICAASGLALPLPSSVERIAASLVPWMETGTMSANEALRAGVGGTILGDRDEGARAQPVAFSPQDATSKPRRRVVASTTIVIPRPGAIDAWPESRDDSAPAATPAAPTAASGPARAGDAPSAASEPAGGSAPPAAAPPASTTPSEPAPPTSTKPSEPEPTSPTPTIEQTVDEVVAPLQPVVDEVVEPVAPVIEDTTKVVDDTLEPVTGILPGLGK